MSDQAAVTVDSLIKFSNIKKKFSFANRNNQENSDSSSSPSSSPSKPNSDNEHTINSSTNKSPWKGSARLKEENSSDSDSDTISKKKKKKKSKSYLNESNGLTETNKRKSVVLSSHDEEVPFEPLKKKGEILCKNIICNFYLIIII